MVSEELPPRTLKALRFGSGLIYESHLAHWRRGEKLLFVDSNGGQHAEFDLETQKWTAVPSKSRPAMSLYHARSAWDTRRDLWIFRKGPQGCTFDPGEKKYETLPNGYMQYDPERDIVAMNYQLECFKFKYVPASAQARPGAAPGPGTRVPVVPSGVPQSLEGLLRSRSELYLARPSGRIRVIPTRIDSRLISDGESVPCPSVWRPTRNRVP